MDTGTMHTLFLFFINKGHVAVLNFYFTLVIRHIFTQICLVGHLYDHWRYLLGPPSGILGYTFVFAVVCLVFGVVYDETAIIVYRKQN